MLPNTINRSVLLMDQKPHITIDEFHKLLTACADEYNQRNTKTEKTQYIRDRNIMIMELMWVTGARVTDVINFKVSDVDTYTKRITFYVHKRNHMHTLPLESDVIIHIQNYLNRWQLNKFLFGTTPKQDPISRKTVNAFLKKYSVMARINRSVHPHLFRHGCAVRMVEAGIPLEVVAFYLDHASTTTTTQFYARITDNVARTVIFERLPSMLG
jgi:integrase/recombinase XerD